MDAQSSVTRDDVIAKPRSAAGVHVQPAPAAQGNESPALPTPAWGSRSSILPREPGSEKINPLELKQRAMQGVKHWINLANLDAPRRWGKLAPYPDVRFDLRGDKAGEAVSAGAATSPLVRLNEDLLRRYPSETLENTIPHECAHVITDHVWGAGVEPHGAEWRSVMELFGKEPDITHNMVTEPARQTPRYAYICDCPGKRHELGVHMHRNLATHTRHYACLICNAVLRPLLVTR